MGQENSKKQENDNKPKPPKYGIFSSFDRETNIISTAASCSALSPVCRITGTRNIKFEYNSDMDNNSLKAFFDARLAIALFDKTATSVTSLIKYSYCVTFEKLQDVIKDGYQVEIIIFGDDEIIETAQKMIDDIINKTKQRLNDSLIKAKELLISPPKYEEPIYVPSAPAKEI